MTNSAPLTIHKIPGGGFLVRETPLEINRGFYCQELFASTTIDESLDFIRKEFTKEVPE
jgi:hypothetical protein